MWAWLVELPWQPVCVQICLLLGKDGCYYEQGNGRFVTTADYLDYRSDISDNADWNLMKLRNDAAHLWIFGGFAFC